MGSVDLILFRVVHPRWVCGFEVDPATGRVVEAAPKIRKSIVGLPLADALLKLRRQGCQIGRSEV